MAKSDFKLEDFKASIMQGGVARNTRFEITFHPPEGGIHSVVNMANRKEMSIRCHAGSIPPFTVETRDYQIGSGQIRKMPIGINHGNTLEFSFYNDAKSIIYQTLLAWSHAVLAHANVDNDHSLNYYDQYAASKIIIKQLDEQDNVRFTFALHESYPILVEKVGLDSTNVDTAQTISLTLTYRYASPEFSGDVATIMRKQPNNDKKAYNVTDSADVLIQIGRAHV